MHCAKLIPKSDFFNQRKKNFHLQYSPSMSRIWYILFRKWREKKSSTKYLIKKSKLSKSFNKKRIDKNVSSMIKQKSFDSEDRRIQIRALPCYFKINYSSFFLSTIESKFKAESKFKRRKFHSFIASISSLTVKEFVRIQQNKNREELKWKRAQIFIQRVKKRNRRAFHRFFKDFSYIVAIFIEHLLKKSMNNEFEWISFISSAFFEISLNLAIFESSLKSSNDIENFSLFNFKVRD